MALKQAAKDALKARGFDPDKLIAAAKEDAEVDVDVTEGTFLSPTDLAARDTNMKAAGKKEAEPEGENKGKELAAKSLKKKFGIEDAEKDLDKVIDLVNEKVGKGDAGLKEQNALLIKDKERLTGELQAEKKRAEDASFDSRLVGMFPAGRGADLPDAERLALIKMNLTFEKQDDGKEVVKRNGEVLRDPNTQNPLGIQQVISDYFTERKWVNAGGGGKGGRGGQDNPPPGGSGGIKKLSEAQNAFMAENPSGNVASHEFDKYLQGVMKDVPDFEFDV